MTYQQCSLYKTHTCAVLENHHVVPKSWFIAAAKPITTRQVKICPNCHTNIHAQLDIFVKNGGAHHVAGDPEFAKPRIYALASEAWYKAKELGLTPARTL